MGRIANKAAPKWKKLFIALLVLNLAVIVFIIFLVFGPVKENPLPKGAEQEPGKNSEFIVRSTKDNLNQTINAYLDNLVGQNNYRYQVILDEDVHLRGEVPVFSSTLPVSVHLEPFVQDNGDVILKLKEVSLGMLELPNKRIMEYIDEHMPKPEWVTINPRSEEIYVALTKMKIKSNFHVRAEHIDLKANNIAFKLYVPYKELGIEKEE